MKKYFIALYLLTAMLVGFSQVPGFQGKKFLIKYDCGIMHPIIVGRSGALPMIYNNLGADYVVSRAWTVGVKYGFMTYNSSTDRAAFYRSQDYYGIDEVDPKDFKGRYTQHVVSFLAKKFAIKKGYIAPVGRYIILGVYYQYSTDHLNLVESTYSTVTGEAEYAVKAYKSKAHFVGFTIGMGRNFIVARRMVIDINFCLSMSPYIILDEANGTRLTAAVWRNLTLRNLFQINLGLGALAF